MPKEPSINSILLIGSGPIVIGQACEFDYSGSQAARSLRENGFEVVLVNSNPATIMTDPLTADQVYLRPLTVDSVRTILEEQPQIDAVLPTMGGQTALNVFKEATEQGLWEAHGVRAIGVDLKAVDQTENREAFRQLMEQIGVKVPRSQIANSFLEGKEIAQEMGLPLVLRPSYTLGGSGGAVVREKEAYEQALQHALEMSPVHEVLIDQGVLGWKEFELELLRDKHDNVCIICAIENMDPMGVHTGDSITVAPAMTLSDYAYQRMRDMAITMMRSLGNFSGGCNVQFAMNPADEEIVAIEINPRVSRSSALASKATGYPIAKIAGLLATGFTLDELVNPVTQNTSAFFEPLLDYVIVKIPRWNFRKLLGYKQELGFSMKAVGEVMGIGRSFNEALQKACQSLETDREGLSGDGKGEEDIDKLVHSLEHPSEDRFFHIKDGLERGLPLKSVQKLTRMDSWFLNQIQELVNQEKELRSYQNLEAVPAQVLEAAKREGFSDAQIAYQLNTDEETVYQHRQSLGLERQFKVVDTCAAEFPSETPYFYSTYETYDESPVSDRSKIIVLGSGPNRIGQGIEFDYCCVHGIQAIKEAGYEAIMVNCNPETVSTDFDISDKLYFEPVYWEHLRSIIEKEQPEGVVVQLGGQTALKLSEKLYEHGIPIVGTSFQNMDLAEDRGSFSNLLKELDIPYPKYGVATTVDEALNLAHEVGYPILVRPSYVLGGQGMKIVINDEELERTVLKLLNDIPGNQILIDHFFDRAEEAETDSICDGEQVTIMGTMEHMEPAGIHSGDSYSVLPAFNFSQAVLDKIHDYTHRIALALGTQGLINIQFAVKDQEVYVIEANPRASRTMPFIAKSYGVPFLNYATKVMLGTHSLREFEVERQEFGYAIKEPVFSFHKFPEVGKELGPEMKSTGESIRFVPDTGDDYFRELYKRKSMYLSQ